MKLHYSREGYEGNYTYISVCGKKVKTHQEKEGSTVHPNKANCKKCLATKVYQTDLNDLNTNSDIKRRIFISSDLLNATEFRSAQFEVYDFAKMQGLTCVDRGFSQVLDFAWHDLEQTWEAVRSADEIYAISSLMPMAGGGGAPVIFNGMCERAVKENITGKSVIILNELKHVYWHLIDIKLMKQAFKKNDLYMYNNTSDLIKIDITKIKK